MTVTRIWLNAHGNMQNRLGDGNMIKVARKSVYPVVKGKYALQITFRFLIFLHDMIYIIYYRQENKIMMNHAKFPTNEFYNSAEFFKITKKLFWSCHENITRFGYKRRRMDLAYPSLCSYYDQYFYTNSNITASITAGELGLLKMQSSNF